MKLPSLFSQLLQKKDKPQSRFLTLLLDVDSVQAAVWNVAANGMPQIIGTATREVEPDSWEERLEVCDRAIAMLEDKEGTTALHKVILGLPAAYLTPAGEIQPTVRSQIKKLTQVLELEPMGFVPIHQAIIYAIKKEEGVPPSAILVAVNNKSVTVSLYKVGESVGSRVIARDERLVDNVEAMLRSFKDVEILPSRMLLYGVNQGLLEEVKAELLRHPWQTKVNFLHFPKIEGLPLPASVNAVSLAGASEMGQALTAGIKEEKAVQEKPEPPAESTVARKKPMLTQEEKPAHVEEPEVEEEEVAVQEEEEEEEKAEAEAPEEEMEEEEEKEMPAEPEVEVVAPEAFGFKKGADILEQPLTLKSKLEKTQTVVEPEVKQEVGEEEPATSQRFKFPLKFPVIVPFRLPKLHLPALTAGSRPVIAGIVILAAVMAGFLYWVLPRATVTVLETLKTFEDTAAITINPQATMVDATAMVIPGQLQEKSVSGEKKIPVTGKKKVGDPAKGSVTIYNKTTAPRLFRKGEVLETGSLQFTLDDDVTVASASENLASGTLTFGKGPGSVTAVDIGPQGNLPVGMEFDFKDTSSSVAVARNDAAFSGGTSREVTVVSRADYDALVKALSSDLLENAKAELESSVSGSEKLIADTVKTTVTDKSFTQELDQEASELQGKVTVSVTGISYNEKDLATLLDGVLATKVPQGYALDESQLTANLSNVSVKKDGKITAKVQFKGIALPQLDTAAIQRALAGKKLTAAQQYLQSLNGVAGVEFSFRFSPSRSRLPINYKNISVTLAIKE